MKKILLTSLAALVLPAISFAAPELPQNVGNAGGGTGVAPIVTVIEKIGNWMYGILLAVAAIFILLAAFKYITAKGDAKALGEARQAIIYALVGVAVAVLTTGLIAVAKNIALGVL